MNNNNKKIVFNKDMTIGQVLELNPNTRGVLMGFGMHCFGCPVSQMETLEEACAVHDIELDYLLEKLNEADEFNENEENYLDIDEEF